MIHSLTTNDGIVNDTDKIADEFNNYFINIGKVLASDFSAMLNLKITCKGRTLSPFLFIRRRTLKSLTR
jgi:hypothetical protein